MNLQRWAASNSKATAVSQDRKATDDGFCCKLHDTGLLRFVVCGVAVQVGRRAGGFQAPGAERE